jgi:DNA-directed RNA polymerase specialized sigma24 family protein
MALTPDIIEGARKLRPRDVTALLRDQFPSVYRLSYALAGRWDVGRGIARFVLARSVRMMPKWKPEEDPSNWFHRFTIMTSRRSARHTTDVRKDVLVEQALGPDNEYVAFVAALRQLEAQQREAFLLHHCERLNARYSALAMDCSTQAAENHLKAAEQSLRLVAGTKFDPLSRKLCDAYAHLTPDGNDVVPQVNKVVFRHVRLRRWIGRIVLISELLILGALLWGGWKVYEMIRN